jgi:hypothetical protein
VTQRLHGGEFGQIAAAEEVRPALEYRSRRIVGGVGQVLSVADPAGYWVELDDRARGGQLLGDATDYQQVLAAGEHDLPRDRRREMIGRPGDPQSQRRAGGG